MLRATHEDLAAAQRDAFINMPEPGFSLLPAGAGAGGAGGAGSFDHDFAVDWDAAQPRIFLPHGVAHFDLLGAKNAARQTTAVAPTHGSGGFQTLMKAASARVKAAEADDEILSGEASGYPRDSATYINLQACFKFAETHDAWVKAPDEPRAERRSIGWLVKMLRPFAGGHVWEVIHNRGGQQTFDSHGYNVQIVNKGGQEPGAFAGARQQLARTSAAEQLRDAHARLALTLSERNPTYRLHFVNADGHVTGTSGPLDRATCLEALREGGFGADPGSVLRNARDDDGIASLTVGDASVIVTRVLGTSGIDVDVVAVTDENGRHASFLSKMSQAQRRDMVPRFGAFLLPAGFEMLKLKSVDPDKSKSDWLPPGWSIFEGVDLLFTGVQTIKKEVDSITGFFKGEKGCANPPAKTGDAMKRDSGIAGCLYFEAHYYACDGATQPAKSTSGSKVAK